MDLNLGELLAFDTDSADFARGFEAGRLWAVLRQNATADVVEYAHTTNAEMVLRLAEATGRSVSSEELGDGWLEVTFGPAVEEDAVQGL
jgi:hypothetical protein